MRSHHSKHGQKLNGRSQRGTLALNEAAQLWDCLYLRSNEVEQLLAFVKNNASYEFIYPMFAMAAYTGAAEASLCDPFVPISTLKAELSVSANASG